MTGPTNQRPERPDRRPTTAYTQSDGAGGAATYATPEHVLVDMLHLQAAWVGDVLGGRWVGVFLGGRRSVYGKVDDRPGQLASGSADPLSVES